MTTVEMEGKYKQYQRTVEKLVWMNAKKLRIHPDDMRSEINALFVGACQSWARRCAQGEPPCVFISWLYRSIRWGLMDEAKRMRRRHVELMGGKEAHRVVDKSFELELCLMEVSEDARYVMEMVLQPPFDVRAGMRIRKYGGDEALRDEIVRFLRASEWSEARVESAFQEAQEALYDRRSA